MYTSPTNSSNPTFSNIFQMHKYFYSHNFWLFKCLHLYNALINYITPATSADEKLFETICKFTLQHFVAVESLFLQWNEKTIKTCSNFFLFFIWNIIVKASWSPAGVGRHSSVPVWHISNRCSENSLNFLLYAVMLWWCTREKAAV